MWQWLLAFPPASSVRWSCSGRRVNVNLDKTLNPSDAFATQFAVANGSNFSMRQVHFSCIVNMPPMVINNHNEPEVPLDEVNAGETVVRGCGMVTKDVPFNSTIDVEVTYQYPLLGTRQVSVHFESRRDTNGIPQWFKTIKTPARLSTQ